jgi:hypothetical protein
MLAGGQSRRQVLEVLARGAAAGALALLGSTHVGAQPGCRKEGHPCEGNQTCCPGLSCAVSGPGAAERCTAEQRLVAIAVEIDVEADCAYSGEMRRTICTFTAASGQGTVDSLAVPESLLCAEVVGGDYQEVDLGANARPKDKAKGLKSKQKDGEAAVVTVELTGEVTVAATATYWCETDGAALIPVTGPGLRCEGTEAGAANEVTERTGAVVVQTYSCGAAGQGTDTAWFEVCGAPTTTATFRLSRLEAGSAVEVATQETDTDGLCRFGSVPPGTYRLEQTDGTWCHAESDSVDEQGGVVVEAGAQATVWVFHCPAK